MIQFRLTETTLAKWEIGLLKIIPKRGNLSNNGNYRYIMMLEITYKILANILRNRLKPIKESVQLGHEWNVKMVLDGNGVAWNIFLP